MLLSIKLNFARIGAQQEDAITGKNVDLLMAEMSYLKKWSVIKAIKLNSVKLLMII